jgi:hypothetical protein
MNAISKLLTERINFGLLFLCFSVLTVMALVSFWAYWAIEEGYSGENGEGVMLLGRLAFVFRFPTHNILWPVMESCSGGLFMLLFVIGLVISGVRGNSRKPAEHLWRA